MLQPHLSIGNWETYGHDATTVRFAVFVAEQGVCAEHELDALDPQSLHAVIRIHHQPVATGRLCPDGRIGRMAVLAQFRNQGLGRMIMATLTNSARSKGYGSVILHAQCHALGFYEKQGFIATGRVFEEEGIPHQHMHKML